MTLFPLFAETATDLVLAASSPEVIAARSVKESHYFAQLGIALLLGLLVGLQRERSKGRIGIGMRTFPLVTIFGTICAQISLFSGGVVFMGGLLCLTAVLVIPILLESYFISSEKPGKDQSSVNDTGSASTVAVPHAGHDPALTTQVAALVMFGVGGVLVYLPLMVGVAVGGTVAILLQFKIELHKIAARLTETDMKAIMQFVLVTFIILPVLPNKTFQLGGLNIINLWETWVMVVLIVGLGLFGYVAYMIFGRDAGIFLGGFLGGAISSTATTVSYARQAKVSSAYRMTAPVVIMIASSVLFVRVFVEIAVISLDFLWYSLTPLLVNMALMTIPAVFLYLKLRKVPMQMPPQENPTQLKPALMFGLMYAGVSFALGAAKETLGDSGLYAISAISGTTSMDAVTLSVSRMIAETPVDQVHEAMQTGWRLILVGLLANLVAKSLFVAAIADRQLFQRIVQVFAIPFLGGLLTILFWPG